MLRPERLHPDDPLRQFATDLTLYLEKAKAGKAPRHQLTLARWWEKSAELTLRLQEPKHQTRLGLTEAKFLSPGLSDKNPDDGIAHLRSPFQVFVDTRLPDKIGETPTRDLLTAHCDSYLAALADWYDYPAAIGRLQRQIRYPDRLEDEEKFYQLFNYPTHEFPQGIGFITDEKYQRLFETQASPWVFSGPTIWVTTKGLANLNSMYAIEQNGRHELIHHGFMQQRRLPNHFQSTLELTLAELEADIFSDRQSGASFGPSRPLSLVQEMTNIQLDRKTLNLLRVAINSGLPLEQVINRQPQNYFLSSLALHSLFEFVARKRLGYDITEYHHHDYRLAKVAHMDFITSGMSFSKWKEYHGWSDHKTWWNNHARQYVLSFLPGVLTFDALRHVLFNSNAPVNDLGYASTFIEKYYRAEFGNNQPESIKTFLQWVRRYNNRDYQELFWEPHSTNLNLLTTNGAAAERYLASTIIRGDAINTANTALKMFGPYR